MKAIKQIGRFKFSVKKMQAAKRRIPRIVGNEAVNHFEEGFRQGGGQTDASIGGWKRRKDPDEGRAILVDEEDLKDSIQVIGKPDFKKITVGTKGIPYARRHNEGLSGMPQREFIGDSKELNKKILKTIKLETKRAFR